MAETVLIGIKMPAACLMNDREVDSAIYVNG